MSLLEIRIWMLKDKMPVGVSACFIWAQVGQVLIMASGFIHECLYKVHKGQNLEHEKYPLSIKWGAGYLSHCKQEHDWSHDMFVK